MDDFEKMLRELPKPEVNELRHKDLLAENLMKAKNKATLSLWWLLVPLYILTMLVLKTFYNKTSLAKECWSFYHHAPFLAILLFIIVPLMLVAFYFLKEHRIIYSTPMFERQGILFIPVTLKGWLIVTVTLCCTAYNAYVLNKLEHSVSDFLINLVFRVLFIGAVYSLIAYLTLKRRS